MKRTSRISTMRDSRPLELVQKRKKKELLLLLDNDDDDSRTSLLSHEDITTDVGDVSEEGMEKYLGRHTGLIVNANERVQNIPEYNTTESVNLEADDVNVVAQVHRLPTTDVTSNDDTAPLLLNIQ